MNKKVNFFLASLVIVLLVAFDWFTKQLAVDHLMNQPAIPLMKGVLELQYLENRGAAFGIMQNKQTFFAVITVIVIFAILFMIAKMPANKRFIPFTWTLTFLIAGAVGNLIDRLLQNYVVDFIYFKLINFPIFNVADIYVTCSVAVMILLIIFYYSEEEFDQIAGIFKRGER